MNNNYFSQTKITLIEQIIKEKTYLRELSEKTNIPLSTTHKEIKQMQKTKMILTEKIKNKTYFTINYSSPLTRELIRASILTKIVFSKSFKQITKEKVESIILFGSANRGTIDNNSDIDLGIIVKENIPANKIAKFRIELGKELNREIQTTIIDKKTNDENNETLKNILSGTKLYGKSI